MKTIAIRTVTTCYALTSSRVWEKRSPVLPPARPRETTCKVGVLPGPGLQTRIFRVTGNTSEETAKPGFKTQSARGYSPSSGLTSV